jgi:capsular exopolysaccharide synthesis family protein
MAQYELNVLDYWLIIKKHKYTILFTAVLVLVATFVLTQFLKPIPLYEATARVKFARATTVANLMLESVAYNSEYDLTAQPDVIRSFSVIERAAKELGMLSADATSATRRSTEYLRTVYALQGTSKTARERRSNIIDIIAFSKDPKLAERAANAVAEAYRAENIQSQNRMVTESRRFVEGRVASLQVKLEDAEEAILDFKERERQVFLTAEAKAALNRFTSLEAEHSMVLRLEDEAKEQMSALENHEAQDGSLGEPIFTQDPAALLSVLNGRFLDLQQERTNLLINYKPRHPQVKAFDQKISHVKKRMARQLESKIKNLRSRAIALEKHMDRYRERYFRSPVRALELARLEREVEVSSDLYASLKAKHQELLIKGSQQIEEVTILEPAVAPSVPVNAPDVDLNIMVGTVLGMFLGFVVAFMRESFDTSIATIEGVEEFIKVPVLGVIPQIEEKELREAAAKELPPDVAPETLDVFSKLICLVDQKSFLSESYRSLRTNLQFANMERKAKTLLVTSAALGEGKTTTLVNLAITLAQDGKRVLIVDADLRRPILHTRLGVPREPGLCEVLVGPTPWRESVRNVTDLMIGHLGVDRVLNTPGLDNLSVLTSGSIPSNPAEFLNLEKVPNIIQEMGEEFDIVLLDTPPILPVADAVLLSSKVDGVVLVYQVGRIGRDTLRRAKSLLDHAQAKVMGVVLTNVRAETYPDYGYYRYGYT